MSTSSSSKPSNAGGSASKKIRMTMACERCRAKKVKCDFTHPQCSRCQHAKAECSYDGSATQIDLFNLVKLNETVDILQEKLQAIESNLKDVCDNTQLVADEVRSNRGITVNDSIKRKSVDHDASHNESSSSNHSTQNSCITSNITKKNINGLGLISSPRSAQWSLSLTPKGLRIDTDIVSLHDLYDILLSGVSHFDFGNTSNASTSTQTMTDAAASTLETASQTSSISTSTESPRPEAAIVLRKKPLWKSRLRAHPLYSSWHPEDHTSSKDQDEECLQRTNIDAFIHSISRETKQRMISILDECFLCFSWPDPSNNIASRFEKDTLDPLLANAVFAWTARHAAIYHNLFPQADPNEIGQPFFLKAKELVKERFMVTNVDTMLSLFIMYIYAIGMPTRSSEQKAEVESEAYIYLGLAIRMCLDLKMNLESSSSSPYERELNRRFFWVLYFLETLGTIHSDKAFCLPPKEMITVEFPVLMEHELTGEPRYRREFMIHRFKIARIYRDIINKTTEEKPLLSQITAIDKELEEWRAQLPSYFKFESGDSQKRRWDTTSFKEQACIKLNMEYNFQLCQLHGMFLKSNAEEGSHGDTSSGNQLSTIELLSKDVCVKAAHNTIELFECWIQLKQLWCHFSLENLMMTVVIYGNVLAQPDESAEQRDMAKKDLEKMARFLLSSPVRHHKYVLTLVNKIHVVLKEAANVDLKFDEEESRVSSQQQHQQQSEPAKSNAMKAAENTSAKRDSLSATQSASISATDMPQPSVSASVPVLPASQLQQQQNQTNLPHAKESMSVVNQTVIQATDNPFFQAKNYPYNVLDVASASSVFDIHKADIFAQDMQPFSDFLYTPTLMNDYEATLGDTTIMPNMRTAPAESSNRTTAANAFLTTPLPGSHTQPYHPPYAYNPNSNTRISSHNTTPPSMHGAATSIKDERHHQHPQPFNTNSNPNTSTPYTHYHPHHTRTDSSSSNPWVASIQGSPAPNGNTSPAATSNGTARSRSSSNQPLFLSANESRPPVHNYMQIPPHPFNADNNSHGRSTQHHHQRSISAETASSTPPNTQPMMNYPNRNQSTNRNNNYNQGPYY